ncbi:AAA family ATPase [Faecalimonas umbilicata]|nr:AAA family ATPase [Faecalimonas umbilicata]
MRLFNPYTPGAGFPPSYLAGRDETIEDAERTLQYVENGIVQRSKIYYGLRGVGKTVLLNKIEEIADDNFVMYEHLEVSEESVFKEMMAVSVQKLLTQMSIKEELKQFFQKAASVLKAFQIKYSQGDVEYSFSMKDVQPAYGTADTGQFENDLKEILVSMGVVAKKTNHMVCFFIDEVQYLKQEELTALITALHRINQKQLPILIFAAGLPKIAKLAGDSKSYAERLFEFISIDSLKYDDARQALLNPAEEQGVTYSEDAIEYIIKMTDGYPYFIQEYGKQAWEKMQDKKIDLDCVKRAEADFIESLDKSFFKVRYDRATKREKDFMFGMVKCGDLPCTIAEVAKQMGTTPKSIGPLRSQLIHKGFIYSTSYGEIDFTVPQFDRYLLRINPELEIDENMTM